MRRACGRPVERRSSGGRAPVEAAASLCCAYAVRRTMGAWSSASSGRSRWSPRAVSSRWTRRSRAPCLRSCSSARTSRFSRDLLIEELWAGRPPPSATKILQTYVSQLRRALGRDVIRTAPSAYELRADAGSFDLLSLRAARGRCAGRRPGGRRTGCCGKPSRSGEGRPWPSSPTSTGRSPRSTGSRSFGSRRSRSASRRDLALGASAELVAELELLVGQYPLREGLRAQLMLALYRSGRQAEALAAYRDARRALVETLGIEPALALRQLERAILDQDPTLDLTLPSRRPPVLDQRGPSLKRRSSSFVGRTRELREIRALLRRERRAAPDADGRSRIGEDAPRARGDRRVSRASPQAPCSSSSAASATRDSSRGRSSVSSGSQERPGRTAREALLEYLRDRQALLAPRQLRARALRRAARPRAARRRTRREGARHEPCSSRYSRGTGLPGAGARAAGSVAASADRPAAPDRGDPAVRRSRSGGPARLRALRGRTPGQSSSSASASTGFRSRSSLPLRDATCSRRARCSSVWTRGSISCRRRRAQA